MFKNPYNVINFNPKKPILLTCEHASNKVPEGFSVSKRILNSHWAYDAGIGKVVDKMSRILDATCIKTNYSRLILDVNRNLNDPTLIRKKTTKTVSVTFNKDISKEQRKQRINQIHKPYHEKVEELIKKLKTKNKQILMVCMHSFTPLYSGKVRKPDIGVLYNEHKKLANDFGEKLKKLDYNVKYNQPYSAIRGKAYTAFIHGRKNKISWVEFEVNNKFLKTKKGINKIAKDIAKIIKEIKLK